MKETSIVGPGSLRTSTITTKNRKHFYNMWQSSLMILVMSLILMNVRAYYALERLPIEESLI